MRKLIGNYVYLVRVGNMWYIVRRSGQRSWEALLFTHIYKFDDRFTYHVHGNASTTLGLLAVEGFDMEVLEFDNNIELRKAMFSILKKGKIDN